MFEIRDAICGSLVISEDSVIYSMVDGAVTVRAGKSLLMYGTIGGDLVVECGASAVVYGTVLGRLISDDGGVEVHDAKLKLFKRNVHRAREHVSAQPSHVSAQPSDDT